ncbi:pre-mRNA-splicing factor ISY1 homolog [Lingula anatina]|uniref:Pre-mRNA-splicing factor ISY1 homolog n=1 Tax=Lingula anatina TaxID=7574 RepID=A0A1S3JCA3_LINAN|nr:pre-mRNA-splicing factor ISY1 homolog [Lingula anatina]|eukprot:XP_013407514.1 pre-mRNA-splicing factor ISY1 homolog [Lingula anatina]
MERKKISNVFVKLYFFLLPVIANKVEEWKKKKEAILRGEVPPDEDVVTKEEDIYAVNEHESDEEDEVSAMDTGEGSGQSFIAHVPVPSQKEIEEALLQRKKRELLEKYASEALQAEEGQVKQMMGLDT